MFVLETGQAGVETMQGRWLALGTEISVVGEDGLWSCHIHTDDAGAVIEAGVEVGRPRGIRVVDLRDGSGHLEADVAAGGFSPLPVALDAPVGVVTVATGSAMVERFRRLGVQQVVAGGQASQPNVEEVLAAVEEAVASKVVVLPNHKNLVPIAEHVNGLTTKTVVVVPTRSVLQGLAAMVAYLPTTDDIDGLLDDMAVAAGAIDYGEVAQAGRDATVDGWVVARGDWMGVADGRVVVVDPDRFAVLRGLVAAILPPHAATVTVYAGQGASLSDTKALEAWLGDTHPRVVVRTDAGGQPEQAYLISVE